LSEWTHEFFLSFLFPAELIDNAGPEETKNLAGKNVLRLIQIRLVMLSVKEILLPCQAKLAADTALRICA
jgi:hypothetical protein